MQAPSETESGPSEDRLRRRAADRRHRRAARRRAARLGAAAAVVVLIGSIVIAGGHSNPRAHHPAVVPPGAVTNKRLQQLAVLAQRRARAETRAVSRVMGYTPFVTSGGGHRREVALTFDDGPGPYTPRVLRVLRHFHVHATFFEVGFMERWFHSSTAQAVQAGHAVGDHTETHPQLARLPRSAQRDQIESQQQWLSRFRLPRTQLFRPPFGSFNTNTFSLLRNNRMLMVLWSVDSEDYRRPGTKAVVHNVLSAVKPGAIVLMHDAGGARTQTVAALPTIIRRLRKRHYKLVTVPQLMLDDPPPHDQELPHYLTGG